MKSHNWHWMLIAGAATLIAGHGFTLYYISSHVALSSAVVLGVIAIIVVKHLGFMGPLYAMLRKALRRS
jgi:hypothetical protein